MDAQVVKLSVLITSVPERFDKLRNLFEELERQRKECDEPDGVEVCCVLDNRKQTVGEKRNALMRMMRGRFFTFVDDDDNVAPGYVRTLLEDMNRYPDADVFAFKQSCHTLGEGETPNDSNVAFVVDADLRNGTNEPIPFRGPWKTEYKRTLWHWCVFSSLVFGDLRFPETSLYEDQDWLSRAQGRVRKQRKIDSVLHMYSFMGEGSQTVRFIASDTVREEETGEKL